MRCRRWLWQALVAVVVGWPLILASLFVAAFVWQDEIGPRYHRYDDQVQARRAAAVRTERYLKTEGTLVHDLATGRIRSGDPLHTVIARYPTDNRHQYGPYEKVIYDDGEARIYLRSKDGILIDACRQRTRYAMGPSDLSYYTDKFFEMSAADEALYGTEARAAAAAKRDADMALVGPVVYIPLREPDTLP